MPNKNNKIVRFDFTERLRLTDYIRANWGRIEEERPTKEYFVKRASEDLGLPDLNFNHAQSILAALGLRWPIPKGVGQGIRVRHIDLVRRVEKTEKRIKLICESFGIDDDDDDD